MSKQIGYISVDPGTKGMMCLLVPEINKIEFIETTMLPFTLYEVIQYYKETYNIKVIMIEDVHSIHGTSAKSNFTFGYNVGLINGICRSTRTMVDLVQPKIWQKYIGVKPKSKNIKKEVAEIALRLYPEAEIYGPRGGLMDGKSDSLMIAHYAWHKYK